ncbi:MAG TPA: leucyl/phenylalanyl-tRNA--protein transferase [Candidatus Sulfotelmatobacter sp.]|nr:leucyl/phenylalanyl-tRNA--protein transferase [Candidatus Sulfotelmatobacter sp.]
MPHLTPELLLRAYAQGLFPMAEHRHDPDLFWVDPELRGILPLDRFHLPHRLARTIRQGRLQVTVDRDFEATIRACAEPSPTRRDSWINTEIITLYAELHRLGYAHSVECRQDGILIGGLYGVSLGAAFFGESMFSRLADASKIALVHLVARLRLGRYRLLDTQFITRHLMQFGAVEITRKRYRALLTDALRHNGDFHQAPADWPPQAMLAALGDYGLQSFTQTS